MTSKKGKDNDKSKCNDNGAMRLQIPEREGKKERKRAKKREAAIRLPLSF
jgi:hypothetical protein